MEKVDSIGVIRQLLVHKWMDLILIAPPARYVVGEKACESETNKVDKVTYCQG